MKSKYDLYTTEELQEIQRRIRLAIGTQYESDSDGLILIEIGSILDQRQKTILEKRQLKNLIDHSGGNPHDVQLGIDHNNKMIHKAINHLG